MHRRISTRGDHHLSFARHIGCLAHTTSLLGGQTSPASQVGIGSSAFRAPRHSNKQSNRSMSARAVKQQLRALAAADRDGAAEDGTIKQVGVMFAAQVAAAAAPSVSASVMHIVLVLDGSCSCVLSGPLARTARRSGRR